MPADNIVILSDLNDPQLEVYRNLRRPTRARRHGRFIVEGLWLVERLLASGHHVESLLVDRRRLSSVDQLAVGSAPIYVVPDGEVERLVGFKFHRGVIGCGRHAPLLPWPETLAASSPAPPSGRQLIAVCLGVQDPVNLGSIFRNCAAFGVRTVLLGPGCADPYSRRALRVSMGNALFLQLAVVEDVPHALTHLRTVLGYRTLATVVDAPEARPLDSVGAHPRLAVLFGEEEYGLPPQWQALTDDAVTIPMAPGVDSLNVAVASGIFLYALSREQEITAPGQADT